MDINNVGIHVEFDIGNYRDALKISTQEERGPTASTSSPAFTFDLGWGIFCALSSFYYNPIHKSDSGAMGFYIVLRRALGFD